MNPADSQASAGHAPDGVGDLELDPVGKAGGAPHYEGGGDEGCTVFYSIRGDTPRLLDLMDDEQNIVAVLDVAAFKAVKDAQPSG